MITKTIDKTRLNLFLASDKPAKRTRFSQKKTFFGVFAMVLILVLSLQPLSLKAAGPRLNIFGPYSCAQIQDRDYNIICVRNESTGGDYGTSVSAEPGDVLTFSVYYNNGVADTFAENTTMAVEFSSEPGDTIEVTAFLWADNTENADADLPLAFSNFVNLPSDQDLEFIPGSIEWFPDQTSPLFDNPTHLPFGQSGEELFDDGLNVGDIEGCWEASGFVNFSVRVTDFVDENPELNIDKKVRNLSAGENQFSDSTDAIEGDRLEFLLKVESVGDSDVFNVFVADDMPSELSYVSGSTAVDGIFVSDGIVTEDGIDIGDIPFDGFAEVSFEAIVDVDQDKTVTNFGLALADGVNQTEDEAQVHIFKKVIPPPENPDLRIDKKVRNISDGESSFSNSTDAIEGDRLEFLITVESIGDSDVFNVFVADDMPSELSYVSGSTEVDGIRVSDGIVTEDGIDIGDIPFDGFAEVSFEAIVNVDQDRTVTNFGLALADGLNQIEDEAQVHIFKRIIPPQNPNLRIEKKVRNISDGENSFSNSTDAIQGDRLAFELRIESIGNSSASNVRVSDFLPSQLSYISGSTRVDGSNFGDGIVSGGINIGTMPANDTAIVTFEANVNLNSDVTVTNVGKVRADNANERQDDAQVHLNKIVPVVSPLKKTVANETRPNGTEFENEAKPTEVLGYALHFKNNNNFTLTNVRIFDVLPSHTSFINAGQGGTFNTSQNQITWNIGSLAPGASVTVTYRVRVESVQSSQTIITNQALLKANEIKDVVSNEVRTRVVLVPVPPPKPPKKPVKVVTGSDSLVATAAYSALVSLVLAAGIYLAMRYSNALRMLRLKLMTYKIRATEGI